MHLNCFSMLLLNLFVSLQTRIEKSKKKDKCVFNKSWPTDKRFSSWLNRSTKWRAYCSFCSKDFDNGCSALTSHASGKNHSENSGLKSLKVENIFFKSLGSSETSPKPLSSPQTVESLIVLVSALRAEVLWVFKVLKNNFSLRSCFDLNDLFKSMFPNSEIAKTFKLSRTKCGYLINYGLALFFRDVLLKSINASPYFMISYDESMNKILQDEQMDLQARYWDDNERQVRTRYFDSKFLNRPNFTNLHTTLCASLAKLSEKQLL